MNPFQRLWWEQARSDHGVLLLLRRNSGDPCQQLHHLQMVTEKLGKAYFWRSGRPPRKSHVSFVRFLQALDNRPRRELTQIARVFGFPRHTDFTNWIPMIGPLAYDLERLAPDLAGDGPNPEYPWPWDGPTATPAAYDFEVWRQLTGSGRGRQLLQVIDLAIQRFEEYA